MTILNLLNNWDHKIYSRISILGTILMLIYLAITRPLYSIEVNENYIISRHFVNAIHNIPESLIPVIYLIIITLLTYSFIKKKYLILAAIICFIVFEVGLVISYNTLALQEISSFALCKIKTTIPYNLKLYHFNNEIVAALEKAYPYINETPERIEYFRENFKNLFREVDKEQLMKLNAREISNLAYRIVNESLNLTNNTSFGLSKSFNISTPSLIITLILMGICKYSFGIDDLSS